MLKTLRNIKALGFSEISNEMIKYGGEKRLAVLLKIIFEKIIQHGKISHFFNIGKIIQIIKDEKSSASDCYKETANCYNHTSKSIYACVIDASKAFDKINKLALMHKLMIMTSAVVWRALYAYYEASIA
jgi:hypothetical protein